MSGNERSPLPWVRPNVGRGRGREREKERERERERTSMTGSIRDFILINVLENKRE